jgi:hypothetical protein
MIEWYKKLHRKENKSAEENLAVDVKQAAAGLNQQGYAEIHKKTSRLCES